MIVVTGGAGFIGSAFVWKLNQMGITDILIVDDLGSGEKWKNLVNRSFSDFCHKDEFLKRICCEPLRGLDAVVHMGACSSTTERDANYLMENNFHYTKTLAEYCLKHGVRFVNASSAATYGDGSLGFDDAPSQVPSLQPLNMYGYSKQLFDVWSLKTENADRLVSLKFFNVFGPNEYHKGDMRSVVCKAFQQIAQTGKMKLFRSENEKYPDGGQMRDFVYVKDCVDVMWWLLEHRDVNGIFNLGTGRAETWNDLVKAVFGAMNQPVNIEYIDMPLELRGKYQYYTQANMQRLKDAACPVTFMPLEKSVEDYVRGYLMAPDHYF